MCTTVFDCNEKRHGSSPGNCPNHLLLPFSPLVSLVQESTPLLSHSSAARGHTLRFRGVNPTKQTIIPRGVFLRKPQAAEGSTSEASFSREEWKKAEPALRQTEATCDQQAQRRPFWHERLLVPPRASGATRGARLLYHGAAAQMFGGNIRLTTLLQGYTKIKITSA